MVESVIEKTKSKKIITEEIWDRRGMKYEESITKWPLAMSNNVALLLPKLELSKTDTILEFSAGSGYFTIEMAKQGVYEKVIALDVSHKMLNCLEEKVKKEALSNVTTLLEKDPNLPSIADESVDKIFSLGGFHHVFDQINVMKNFYRVLKKGGKVVIADFRDHSRTQEHFDYTVRQFSSTGHDALFLSKSRSLNLASIAQFTDVNTYDIDIDWLFSSIAEIGQFFILHHDLLGLDEEQTIHYIDKYLGIEKKDKYYTVPLNYCIVELYK